MSNTQEREITLVPYGGLANRMRAIESLVRLIQDADVDGKVVWFKDKGLNSRFDALFQPLCVPALQIKEADVPDHVLCDRPRKKNLFIPALFEHIIYDSCIYEDNYSKNFDFKQWVLAHQKTYLSSCRIFYQNSAPNIFSIFKPIPHLQDKIDDLSSSFSENTIGVHIRRTDHIRCIESSPFELYVEKMKAEIEQNSNTNFYLASDSAEEKEKLIQLFGNRIITQHAPVLRNTLDGMQDALVELFVLSKTKKIFGSPYSTYSLTAAEIGGIEFVDVCKKIHISKNSYQL